MATECPARARCAPMIEPIAPAPSTANSYSSCRGLTLMRSVYLPREDHRVDSFTCATGIRMPQILYGTAWKKADTAQLVTSALRQGFRGIDTACQPKHYEEPGVGAGIAAA